ncbi:hypothetical protein TNIN_200451 [Trichonephila inaurata madagascariensis]|uniref:Uncharacterized protein n=1 Tax=Trichonephila inaurata madagascariensis TaxID=2747483 RepID=A0A8X6MKZ5_9ARAC|nr:hypothetical protein TNIN_200451 [Trichonephila inaurata madagascariensis]
MLGIQRIRTIPYHPFEWYGWASTSLKQAIGVTYKMDRVATSGPRGSRACIKEDLNDSSEMVFGKNPCASRENSLNLQVDSQMIPPSFLLRVRETWTLKPTPAVFIYFMFRAHSSQNLLSCLFWVEDSNHLGGKNPSKGHLKFW